jgi:hypothetical protein
VHLYKNSSIFRYRHSVAGDMGPGGKLIVALAVLWGVSSEDKVRNINEGDGNEEVQTFRDYVKIGLDFNEESEQVYNDHLGHSRFVQYNDLSKILAADSRLVNTAAGSYCPVALSVAQPF